MTEDTGLEFGVKFDVKTGGDQATRDIMALSKQWQDLLEKQKLVIKMGASPENFSGSQSGLNNQSASVASVVKAQDSLVESNKKVVSSGAEKASQIQSESAAYQKQNDMISALRTTALQYLSVYEGARLIKAIADITGEFELQQKSLAAILRDADKAAEIFSQVKSLAVVSPFQVKDLLAYTKQLAAYRIETDQLFDTMKNLADVSAGLGVDMGRIILAYGQVSAASVLRGQELRQFTEAGIPMVSLLADKFTELEGRVVGTGEVFKRISERLVPFAMVKDIFADMTSEGGMFYNMQEIQSETLKGKISNLTDAYNIMFNDIGSGGVVNDVMKGTVDLMTSAANNWKDIAAFVVPAVAAIGLYKASLIAISGYEAVRNVQNSLAIAQSDTMTASIAKETAAMALKTAAGEANLVMSKSKISAELTQQVLSQYGISQDKAEIASKAIKNLTFKAGVDVEKLENLQKEIGLVLQKAGIAETEAEIVALNIKSAALSRASAESTGLFSSIGNLIKLNMSAWITGGITAVLAIGLAFYQWYENSNKLRNELAKLDSDGVNHAINLGNKFAVLAGTALDASKSVKEQDDALKTLKNTYSNILPDQLLTIEGLTKLEGKYDDVTRAIYDNIAAQTKKKKEEAITSDYGSKISGSTDDLKTDLKDIGIESGVASRAVSELQRRIMDKDMEQGNPFQELLIILKEMEGIKIDFNKISHGEKNMGELNSEATDLLNTIRSMNNEIKGLDAGKTTWYGNFTAQAKSAEVAISEAKESIIKGKKDIDGVLTPFDESLYRFNERKASAERDALIAFLVKVGGKSYDILTAAFEKNKTIGLGIGFDKYFSDAVKRIDNLDISPIAKKTNEIIEKMASLQGVPYSQYNGLAYKQQSGVDGESSDKDVIKRHQELEESIKKINRANNDWVSDIKIIDTMTGNITTATKQQELNGYTSQGVRNKGLNEELAVVTAIMNARGLVDKKDKKPQVVNPEIEQLKEQLALVEQAKKAYTELRNSGMTSESSQSKVNTTYGSQIKLPFKIAFDSADMKDDLEAYKKKMQDFIDHGNDPTKRAAIKAKAQVQLLIDKLEIDNAVKVLNDQLKEIETTFNRDKKRIDIFKNLFDSTGDYDLAGRIAKSFEGDGTTNIEIALKHALEKSFGAANMSTAGMFDDKGNVNIDVAQKSINDRRAQDVADTRKGQVTDTKITDAMQKQLDATRDFQEKEVAELLNGLHNFKDYEQKRADIIQKGIEERKMIEKQSTWTPEQKATETKLSLNKQASDTSKVSIEQFKSSDQWAMVFSEIDNVSAPVIDRLKEKLKELVLEANGKLPVAEFKELEKTIGELDKRTRSVGIVDFFKDITKDYGIPKLIEDLKKADSALAEMRGSLGLSKSNQSDAQVTYDSSVKTGEPLEVQAQKKKLLETANNNVALSIANLTAAEKAQTDAEKALATAQNARLVAANKATASVSGMSTAFTDMKNVIDSTVKAFYDVSEAMGIAIDPETKAILDGITKGLGATISVLAAVSAGLAVYTFFASAAGAATWILLAPILAVLAPILLLVAAFSIWHSVDLAKTNAQIAAQAKIVEDLKTQYDALERSMKDALGTQWLEDYNKELVNLGKTNDGLKEQLRLEQSKDSKDQDASKITSLQKDIATNANLIEDSAKKLQQFVTGSDLTSAAKDFAQAWLDAYKSFGSTTDAMKVKFKDMINNMVVNTLLAKVMQVALQPVFDMITKAGDSKSDGGAGFTVAEIKNIVDQTTTSTTNADAAMTLLMEKLEAAGINMRDSSTNLTGVSKGISGVTEDTALLLGGYLNSMRERMFTYFDSKSVDKNFSLSTSMGTLITAQNTQISHLEGIKANTLRSAIASEKLTDQLDKVTSLTGNKGAFSLNVNA